MLVFLAIGQYGEGRGAEGRGDGGEKREETRAERKEAERKGRNKNGELAASYSVPYLDCWLTNTVGPQDQW